MTDNRLVARRDSKPCGCLLTEYGDGSKELSPCAPCGLLAAADALRAAGNAIGAVAVKIRCAEVEQSMAAVLRKVTP